MYKCLKIIILSALPSDEMLLTDLTDVPVVLSNTVMQSGLPVFTQDNDLMHGRCAELGFRVSDQLTKPDGACGITGCIGKFITQLY